MTNSMDEKIVTRWDGDPSLVRNGVWVDLGNGEWVQCKPIFRREFKDYLNALLKPHRRAINVGGKAAEELQNTINKDAVSSKAFYAMRYEDPEGEIGDHLPSRGGRSVPTLPGFRLSDGSVLEDTQPNRRAMLEKEKFWTVIVDACDELSLFQREAEEEDTKNS